MNKDKKNKKTPNINDIVLTIGDYSTQELINIARKKYKRDTRIQTLLMRLNKLTCRWLLLIKTS